MPSTMIAMFFSQLFIVFAVQHINATKAADVSMMKVLSHVVIDISDTSMVSVLLLTACK